MGTGLAMVTVWFLGAHQLGGAGLLIPPCGRNDRRRGAGMTLEGADGGLGAAEGAAGVGVGVGAVLDYGVAVD